jgi:hypothetical protein
MSILMMDLADFTSSSIKQILVNLLD